MKAIFLRLTLLLIVLTLSKASLFAQAPIKKPEKKTTTATTTTTTQQEQRTNKNTSSQSSSSTATKPATGTINGHEWVDLGLSVKWATCNVGASSPSDYGNYYAWGETSTKSEYTWENSVTSGKSMGSIAGNSTYDAARANWGGTWRMPTKREIEDLVNKCKWTHVTHQEGHSGYKVTGPNGNSIFLPIAGGRDFDLRTGYGCYWSATPYEDDGAFVLYWDGGGISRACFGRGAGCTVRPVTD